MSPIKKMVIRSHLRLSSIRVGPVLLGIAIASVVSGSALAQIAPDETLGAERSVVTPNMIVKGELADQIDGGAVRDANLFHSFSAFNVGDGQRVYFGDQPGIENIFSRVTGGARSDIMGTLGVLGSADLFLINPNGIVFGPNARLDVNGSFVASTADGIQFGEQGFFSATEPEAPPLLTINPSAFFFNQIAAAPIENQSTAPAGGVDLLGESLLGLRVPDSQSLLLVGGSIAIDGGRLNALGGRVELAGIAGDGTVGLNVNGNNLSLSIPEGIARADVSLTNGAFVNTSGEGGGDIQVWGRRVMLSDGSQIAATTLGARAGGRLIVNASESVELTGTTADKRLSSGLFTQTGGTGNAGDLAIMTQHLLVQNGARVLTGTFGQGNAGNLTVNASESVQMIGATGFTPFDPSFSSRMGSDTGRFFGSRLFLNRLVGRTSVLGRGGNVTILTRNLRLLDGAQIGVSTRGDKDAGSLTVNASESLRLIGFDPLDGTPSALFSQTRGGGNAGNITIDTGSMSIINSQLASVGSGTRGNAGNILIRASEIEVFENPLMIPFDAFAPTGVAAVVAPAPSSISLPKGNAGNVTIETNRLSLRSGGEVTVANLGLGNAGTLRIHALESVEVVGTSPNQEGFKSQISATIRSQGIGGGGSLSIETGQMIVRDGAEVTVSNLGSGEAGNLWLQARSISLDNQGTITSITRAGNGGNITLTVQDLLLLRRNSLISTTAGAAQAGGDGGDITINAPFIVAVPTENSDIIANAFEGNGGRVEITTQGIIGFTFRSREDLQNLLNTNDPIALDPRNLSTSDITAISQSNPSVSSQGQVVVNTLGIDPSQGLIELSANLVDQSNQIDQRCLADSGQGQSAFVVTGRGGVPPSPSEVVRSETGGLVDLAAYGDIQPVASADADLAAPVAAASAAVPSRIVEAQTWRVNDAGEIELIAQETSASAPLAVKSTSCPVH